MTTTGTPSDEVYEQLRQKMDRWPTRAPKSRDIIQILQELFTKEEAELLVHFKAPLTDRVSPIEIVKRSNKPLDYVVDTLNSLADKGLIFRIGKSRKRAKFAIWPVVIGIFEFFFSNAKIWPEKTQKRVAKLFEHYQERTLFPIISASTYPFQRVIPSTTSEKIININEDIGDVSQKVLPFEEIKAIVNSKNSFSVMNCSCRVHHEILGKGCDKPKETCISFDINAEFFIENGMARRLTREETLELLKDCEKKGLVHTALNGQDTNFICNCCSDCCGILRALTTFHRPGMFATSNFRAVIDENVECKKCYRCFDVCPTHAILTWPNKEDTLNFEINKDLCIGCGLCASNCPTNYLKIEKVSQEVPEKGMPEVYQRYAKERYREWN